MYGASDIEQLRDDHKARIEEIVNSTNATREPTWSESIAIGDEAFVKEIEERLGDKARGRTIVENGDAFMLREPQNPYKAVFDPQKSLLSSKNRYFWRKDDDFSTA